MKTSKQLIGFLLALILTTFCACGDSADASTSAAVNSNFNTSENEMYVSESEDKNSANIPNPNTSESVVEEEEASKEFDVALAGCWRRVEVINSGELDTSTEFYDLCILPDGTFFYDDYENYTFGIKATTSGNAIHGLWEQAWQYDVEMGYVSEDDPAPDMTITYEVSDIKEPMSETEVTTAFYDVYENDKLVLHITGTLQTSPVEVSSVDTTIIYEKNYPVFSSDKYLEAYLLGNWTDSMGNSWDFYYTDAADPEFAFRMTDASGKTHEGKDLFCMNNLDEAYHYLDFYFIDFDMKDYIIVSYDNTTFMFEHDGQKFSLTKVQ